MSDASPPVWIRRLSKQADGLDAAHKFMLITLWAWAPYASKRGTEQDRPDLDEEIRPDDPIVVYPSRETLMEETGQPEGTVKSQLAKLKATGWIERGAGTNMTLAWRWPRNFDASRPTVQPDRTTHHPADTPSAPADTPSAPADTSSAPRLTGRPLTFHLTSKELPSNVPALVESGPEPLVLIPVDPGPDHVGELRALHERLRRDALRGHGKRATSLPTKGKPGAALARRIGEAVDSYGVETCRAVITWRADEWARDPGSLQWSREQAWSARSMEFALARMDSPQGAPKTAQRRSRGLGVEAAPNAPASGLESLGGDDGWAMDNPGRATRVVVVTGS